MQKKADQTPLPGNASNPAPNNPPTLSNPPANNVGPDNQFMQGSIDQISNAGRNILKSIEEYKFKVDQVSRMLKNDPRASGLLEQKKKNLDQAANEIYQLVFSIENIDIVNVANQVPGMQQPFDDQNKQDNSQSNSAPLVNPQTAKDENSGMPNGVVR